ncbi:MAG: hypothetical protein HY275_04180 [Gemmatimonadetes bacterium]|nr:hypothetical protein [Gemmatimonadota bacterium]
MSPDWLPFFEWCEASWLGQFVRTSIWLFPVIEAIHLLALSSLGGAVLLVDLRALGLALTDQPIGALARAASRWLWWSTAVMLVTGVLLFMSEAVKCFHNPAFAVKIAALPFALGYTAFIRARVLRDDALVTGTKSRLVALGSIALWFTVAAAGRWIGFSS